jgi:predicted DNA-binding transcriptional regulator YafY
MITYRMLTGAEIERVVHPLGLVAKEGAWYLVFDANGKVLFRRAEELTNLRWMEDIFPYPKDFDLETFWQAVCAQVEASSEGFRVLVQVDPAALPRLRHSSGTIHISANGAQDGRGWMRLALSFESFEAARRDLLAWGGAVEVLEPVALRLSLADYARQILARYTED